jgi:2',3'-cyclic-nucleotide 2'-phosphodiesterase (5'-nucleotidase family)
VPDGNNGYAQKILPATGEIDRTTNYLLSLPQSLSSGYKSGNTAPVASLDIPDQSLSTGEVVVLNLNDYFTDAEGNMLTYSAKLPNGTMVPEWIKYDQFAKTLTLCPAYPATLTVEVTATDLIDKTSQEFDINVVVANPMLTYLSGIKLGSWGKGAAEISAYDAGTQKLFVTNAEFTTLDIIDLTDPSNPAKVDDVDITTYGAGLQSVAVYNGVVAVAVQPETSTDPGFVVFFDTDGNFLSQVTAGSLPDMLAFTHDGTKLLVANEGEPNTAYTVDPEGSISIIDMTVGAANLTNANVATAGFEAFNGATLDAGIRIFGPNATVAQDIEPEYIAISADNTTAFVTCQENNAFAVVDIATATVTNLLGMGFKNHSLPGNGMDASDRSSAVQIKSWPVFGMYLPDAVDSYSVNGKTYYVTVNEGDARAYAGYSEEARVKDLTLDPVAFPNASWLKKNENLGRLKTTKANGDIDNDGDFDEIYCFGGRSFTIWDENGNVVFDSQDDIEQITSGYLANNFNASHEGNNSFKDRSDDKGPEPEALKIAQIDGRYYAFIGLERVGGIMVYDVTNPNFPDFVEYRNDRNFAVDAKDDLTGHYGPEGIIFIEASESGNGQPLVVVSHEISGSVAIYQVNATNAVLPQMLTVLHNNDGESQLIESSYGAAYGGVANFKFKADSLRSEAFSKMSPAIMLSSGDNFLAGPEFSASLNLPAGQPYYDAVAMDHIGYDAVAMGNHDFDFGPDILEKFIRDYSLTQPPYLGANLDFSNEPGMLDLVNTGRIKKSTVVNLNGTYVGVVGLTTPMLDYISSPRNVIVNDDLVNIAQAEIDSLINLGLNKIILISHLQSIKEDSALISQLRHVDIAIAGGGSELLTNDPSIALPGMEVYGNYPLEYNDADGETVYVVTTPGEYTYVGHLMAEFDIDGNVVSIDPASNPVLVTKTTPDAELKELVEEPVSEYVANLAQNIIATTQVTLDGIRSNVRTLETNEGDLVADAMFWQAAYPGCGSI